MSYPWEELGDSPVITMDRTGGSATRRFRIGMTEIDAFIREFLPDSPAGGYVLGATFPSLPWLVASKLDFRPWIPDGMTGDPNSTLNTYPDGYEVMVTYSPKPWDGQAQSGSGGDRTGPGGSQGSDGGQGVTWLSHSVKIGAEFLTRPVFGLYWSTAAGPIDNTNQAIPDAAPLLARNRLFAVAEDVHPGVILPLIEHSITWQYVTAPPWAAIRACVGRVNQANFAGAPPGTVLFLGGHADRDLTSKGIPYWKLQYIFSEKNYGLDPHQPQGGVLPQYAGWNHWYRSGFDVNTNTGWARWDRLLTGDGSPIYKSADFSSLFVQPTL